MTRTAIGADFYQWLFQNARDIVLVLDADGRVLDANAAAEAAYGYDRAGLLGLTIFDLRAHDGRGLVSEQMARAKTDGAIFEAVHVRRDGTPFPVEVSSRTAELDGQAYFVSLIRDITERKAVEARLRESERALQAQYERLKELDEMKTAFVDTVSHELRTPLASVVGFAEFLEEGVGGNLSDEQRQFVDGIMQAGTRLRVLVDDLLDFAKLTEGRLRLTKQATDLAALARTTLDELTPQARAKALTIAAVAPETPLMAEIDGNRIAQVLRNLLSNAIKFTPSGGTVTVTASRREACIRVEVTDTGIGIPVEEQARLFERFYQVDTSLTRETGGTGLGLSIAKALIESHGGHMGLVSAPGTGSTFWFELPAA